MDHLGDILSENEDWLVSRTLEAAKSFGYADYAGTLIKVWRITVQGLSGAVQAALKLPGGLPEPRPDDEYADDPV
ncbi:MAG: GGDEF domain-containing protein, partial [Proteobacteria bacterium]|nr:GGDEF domain-containing protein [Pseudomonadota bacterium]